MVGLKDGVDLEAAAAGSGLNSGTSGGGLNLVHNFDGRPLGLFTGSFSAGAARFEFTWSRFYIWSCQGGVGLGTLLVPAGTPTPGIFAVEQKFPIFDTWSSSPLFLLGDLMA